PGRDRRAGNQLRHVRARLRPRARRDLVRRRQRRLLRRPRHQRSVALRRLTSLPGPTCVSNVCSIHWAMDLTAIPLERLEAEIATQAAHIAAATCRWLELVAEFDRREGYADWGCRSTAHWLNWRCGIGVVAAREHVKVGRRLAELPVLRAAFASGELSYSKARAVVRVATPETEATLVEWARHATAAQLERIA